LGLLAAHCDAAYDVGVFDAEPYPANHLPGGIVSAAPLEISHREMLSLRHALELTCSGFFS
jgi:hypothetical protein